MWIVWSRALDVRLSKWCCSVSMVWVQIPSREEQTSHYLDIRTTFFNNHIWLPTDCKVDSRLLTCGNDKLTHDQNVDSFNYGFWKSYTSCKFTTAYYIIFTRDSNRVCFIYGSNTDGTCVLDGDNNTNYTYTCNPTTNTYALTIPGSYLTESLHGTAWICENAFRPETSNTKILYVNGELFFIFFVIRALVNVIIFRHMTKLTTLIIHNVCRRCITLGVPIEYQINEGRKVSAHMYQCRTIIYIFLQYCYSLKSSSSNHSWNLQLVKVFVLHRWCLNCIDTHFIIVEAIFHGTVIVLKLIIKIDKVEDSKNDCWILTLGNSSTGGIYIL
jgi:hypothetical protein